MALTELFPSAVGLKESLEKWAPWIPLRGLREIGATPMELAAQEGSLRLLRARACGTREDAPKREFPIVLIPSLINRYYVLDLLPERSLISYFLQNGFDLFVVEWGAPRPEDQSLGLDELISGRLRRAVEKARKISGAEQVHLLGHCLGGTLGLAYGARYPKRVASISLVTAPVDFKGNDLLSVWSRYPGFDLDAFVEAHGNTPWPVLQLAFHSVRPGTGLLKLLRAAPRFGEEGFLADFMAMEAWGADNVSLPGAAFRDILKLFYRENRLAQGTLEVAGKTVKLQDLSCPVVSIAGRADHIVLLETTLAAGEGRESWVSEGGHIGAILGKRSQREIWPRLIDWLVGVEQGSALAS